MFISYSSMSTSVFVFLIVMVSISDHILSLSLKKWNKKEEEKEVYSLTDEGIKITKKIKEDEMKVYFDLFSWSSSNTKYIYISSSFNFSW